MKLSARNLRIAATVWGATALPLAAFHVFVGAPQSAALERLRAALDDKERDYAALVAARAERDAGRVRAELDGIRSAVGAFVASPEAVSGIDLAISERAHGKGLENFSSKIMHGGANPALGKLEQVGERNFKLSFEADFRSFLSFINELERQEPVIFVDAFTLGRDMAHETRAIADVELSVLFEKATAGGAAGPGGDGGRGAAPVPR
jgi:hypothetical protein